MTIIEIFAQENGGHHNQTINTDIPVPDGWAVVPDDLFPLENYPFGTVEVAEINSIPAVTGWTPLPMPEGPPVPEPEVPVTADTLAAAYLAGVQEA